jgi:fatty-acyl-CoA synthase
MQVKEDFVESKRANHKALQDWVRALEATTPILHNSQRILPLVIEEFSQTRGDSAALISARECLTYYALAARINRYARWALEPNLGKGETVCLMMPNRPEYMAIWLGITSVGGVVSLLNTNLRGLALAHCINTVAPRHIIVAAELIDEMHTSLAHLNNRPTIWSHGGSEYACIGREVQKFSPEQLSKVERRDVTIADRALYIYTSGTTGLPKAANVSHRRLMQWSFWFAGLMNTGPGDRMYDCLPMYHSIGGIVATGSLLVHGGSVAIREKFSAQQFWEDVVSWDCTLFQYIGELCRYVVNGTNQPLARHHRLRLCCGNGLRADVWEKFQRKFEIPRILEFYASTEGNISLYNVEGKVGAIGRIPPFLSHRFPLALVKFDAATEEPARKADGLCIRCATDEIGVAIGKIRTSSEALRSGADFEGYADPKESERKIVRDVFERGDAWYRTGDLMRCDASGFFYFVGRSGDTFRWKGENVATSEVTAAIIAFPGIVDAIVYGVPVPGCEGAAGMAALVTIIGLNLSELHKHLAQQLPRYARPQFLRIKDQIDLTATFKHMKADLVREKFNPAATGDTIYFDDPSVGDYVKLDAGLFQRIQDGNIRI